MFASGGSSPCRALHSTRRAHAEVSPDEPVAYCKERMAAYKYPRIVEIIDELPKTMTRKILRREMRG